MNHGGEFALEAKDDAILAPDEAAESVDLLRQARHLQLFLLQHSGYVFLLAKLAHLVCFLFTMRDRESGFTILVLPKGLGRNTHVIQSVQSINGLMPGLCDSKRSIVCCA